MKKPDFDDGSIPPSDPMLGLLMALLLAIPASASVVGVVWRIYEIGKRVLGVRS